MKAAMNTSRIVTRKLAKWLDEREKFDVIDTERSAFVVETIVEAVTHRIIVDKAQDISERDLEDVVTRLLTSYFAHESKTPTSALHKKLIAS